MSDEVLNMVKVGKLRGLRRSLDISQADVAKKLGYANPRSYARIESGETEPKYSVMEAIASILEVDISEIFDVK